MERKLDAILIHHHTHNPHRPILLPAMGLLGIAEFLERNGIHTQVVNLGVEQRVDPRFDIVQYVSATNARVVGLSVHWFFQLPDSLALAQELKRALPHVRVVLGGFSASLFASDIIQDHPYVDAVVRGDGELPFLELCGHYLDHDGEAPVTVPNLVYRDNSGIHATPFSHVISEAELAGMRFANMSLLKNHEAFFKLGYYPTRRFRDRIDFGNGGLFVLQAGRGCPFSCTFCGGSREAQRSCYNRSKPLFQPVEAVLSNIRQAMEYGYQNFYVCFDPVPNGSYYFDLFDAIRRERWKLGFIFGCWGLPSPAFIDAFAATFDGGILEISPETADDRLRRRSKGQLAFSNEQLDHCLAYLEKRDVACQLFYGFFVPGDTEETVQRTLRLAHRQEGPKRETFYLAFSTDPGSMLQSHPEEHDVVVSVRTLRDYLDALGKKRLSPNLLAHRPASMTQKEASGLELRVAMDQFLYKLCPAALRLLRTLAGDDERFHGVVSKLSAALATDAIEHGMELRMARALELLGRQVRSELGDEADVLLQVIGYESTPYGLLEQHFGRVGMHYSSYCVEAALAGDELDAFRGRPDTVTIERHFPFDVKSLVAQILADGAGQPETNTTIVGFVVEQTGRFATYYVDGAG